MSPASRAALFLVGPGIALCGFLKPALPMQAGPASLGTVELKGGTTVVEFYAAAVPTRGAVDITGTLKNIGPGTATYDGVTISVTRKNSPRPPGDATNPRIASTRLEKDGDESLVTRATHVTGGDRTEHRGMPGGPMGTDDEIAVDIDLDSLGDATWIVVAFTPSDADKPKGSDRHANRLAQFALRTDSDLARNTIGEMWTDRLAFDVVNDDFRFDLERIDGVATLARGSQATIQAVYLQNPDAGFDPVPCRISIDGNTFRISGFTPLDPGDRYEVVLVFSEGFSRETVKVQVEATFAR